LSGSLKLVGPVPDCNCVASGLFSDCKRGNALHRARRRAPEGGNREIPVNGCEEAEPSQQCSTVDGSGFHFHLLSTAATFGLFRLGRYSIYESCFRELALQPTSAFLLILRPLQPPAILGAESHFFF
jgi:hypothetical protein